MNDKEFFDDKVKKGDKEKVPKLKNEEKASLNEENEDKKRTEIDKEFENHPKSEPEDSDNKSEEEEEEKDMKLKHKKNPLINKPEVENEKILVDETKKHKKTDEKKSRKKSLKISIKKKNV